MVDENWLDGEWVIRNVTGSAHLAGVGTFVWTEDEAQARVFLSRDAAYAIARRDLKYACWLERA